MKSRQQIMRFRSFWSFQITGWITYGLIYYLHLLMFEKNYVREMLFVSLMIAVGLVLTSLLRFVYRKININSVTLLTLISSVIFISIFTANLWFWGSRIIWLAFMNIPFNKLLEARTLVFFYMIFWESLVIFGWSGLYYTLKFWLEREEQQRRMEQANSLAQQAQLQMLRYQINPHFLFNSLHSIRALIAENKQEAKSMVTELAEFLRFSLLSKEQTLIPLNKEIEALKHYYYIEKKRFDNKLEMQFDIEPEASDYPMLSFILHPLVENVITYGLQSGSKSLRIFISASLQNEALQLEVSSNSVWIPAPMLANPDYVEIDPELKHIEERLRHAYNGKARFEVVQEDEHLRFTIQIKSAGVLERVETV